MRGRRRREEDGRESCRCRVARKNAADADGAALLLALASIHTPAAVARVVHLQHFHPAVAVCSISTFIQHRKDPL